MYSQVYCPVDGNGLIRYKFLLKRCSLTCSSGPSTPLDLSSRHRHFMLNKPIDDATSLSTTDKTQTRQSIGEATSQTTYTIAKTTSLTQIAEQFTQRI
jgi:hypothetical protein